MHKMNRELNAAIIQSLLGKYSLYVFQLLSLAVLARLFTPDIFGTLAALQVLIIFFQLLATSGLGPAIIYKEQVLPLERDGVFSVTCIIGTFFAFIFIFITPVLGQWLNLGNIRLLTFVLSLNVFFSALSMLPLASLQKDTQFYVIARAEVFAEAIAFSVCICGFFLNLGIIALASKLIITPIARFIFYYHYSASTLIGRPHLGRKLSSIFCLVSMAKFQLAFSVLNFFSRNLDTLLVAKYFGVNTVGFYEKTYQVMRYPLQLFTFAIVPALQPILTRYKHDPNMIFTSYYRLAYKLAGLGLLTSFVMFWCASDIIFILFGPQWFEASRILQILALSIPIQMVLSSTGGVYQAMGATKQMFHCGLFSSVTSVSAIIWGVYKADIEVLCISLVLSFIINFLQCFYVLHRHVFCFSALRPFAILLFVSVLGCLNFMFLTREIVPPVSYSASLVNIFTFALPSSLILLVIYYFFSKKQESYG
jgi:O-antigen/teichoic acid export membrane protein